MWNNSKVIVTVVVLTQWIILSVGVVLTPCRVENILTQPHYATSLASKALVQIIQIPPVFTQNVMVGKCVNKDLEMSGRPGDYFICRQRYSSVEVYVTEHTDFLQSEPNSTNETGGRDEISSDSIFKSTNFIRESVVVESGCDFTFNLLPLLMRRQEASQQQTGHTDNLHNYRVLKSPYHTNHPVHSLPPTPFIIAPSIPTGNLQGPPPPPSIVSQSHQQGGGNQYSSSNNPSIHSSGGPVYTSFGNPPQAQTAGGATYIQTAPSSHSIPLYGDQQQQQQQQRPSMAIRERAEHEESPYYPHRHEQPPSSTESYSSESSNYSEVYGGGGEYSSSAAEESRKGEEGSAETAYTADAALRPQEGGGGYNSISDELYGAPHKIGMPLLILAKEYDPLLKNIQTSPPLSFVS